MKLCAHHTMSHDCEVCHENPEPSPLEFQFVWKETLGMVSFFVALSTLILLGTALS